MENEKRGDGDAGRPAFKAATGRARREQIRAHRTQDNRTNLYYNESERIPIQNKGTFESEL
jgi:hypothetical protein